MGEKTADQNQKERKVKGRPETRTLENPEDAAPKTVRAANLWATRPPD